MREKTVKSTDDNKNKKGTSTESETGEGNSWNQVSQSGQKLPVDDKSNNDKPNDYDFVKELSERFVKQQDQTVEHRSTLMTWFAWITASQLVIINVLILVAVFWKPDMVNVIFDFLKFFIGATFLELLGGLIIIVKFAFSHETYDMLKHLTYVDPKSQ